MKKLISCFWPEKSFVEPDTILSYKNSRTWVLDTEADVRENTFMDNVRRFVERRSPVESFSTHQESDKEPGVYPQNLKYLFK